MGKYLALIAIALALLIVVVTRTKAFSGGGGQARIGEQPLPPGTTRLLVSGWTEPELAKILTDFAAKYSLPANPFEVARPTTAYQQVAFQIPHDIALLFFLANYVAYPEGFDPKGREIGAVAEFVLSDATGVPNGAASGEKAWAYVPVDDTEYDLVYARTAGKAAHQISFTDMKWQLRSSPRMPAATKRLIDAATAS